MTYIDIINKRKEYKMYTKEMIKSLLASNDKAVCKGILAIYARQTAAEQSTMSTNVDNGIGFNAVDAAILSSFAKGILKYGRLTKNQMVIARTSMMKYSGQLASIANEKNAA